jgi:hypothetical protein
VSNQKTLDGDDRIAPVAFYDRATGLPIASVAGNVPSIIRGTSGLEVAVTATSTDNASNGNSVPALVVQARGYVFNGIGWDRARGDTTGVFVKPPTSAGTNRSATATTTSAALMAANTLRSKFFVRNDSAIDVWINLGAAAVATPGGGNIKVAANGGHFEFTGHNGVVNIIAASATAAVTAREY